MTNIRMAVIGAGHLGRIHARLLAANPDVELVGLAEVDSRNRQAVAEQLKLPVFNHYRELPAVDAVVIATPTVTHFEIAQDCLLRGLDVLVEKPLAPTMAEGKLLANLAREQGRVLQVGHVERFNAAFRTLQAHADTPLFIDARRTGPYSFRSTDIGVVLDLMIHDIDLVLSLVPSQLLRVSACAQAVFGGHEDVAQAQLEFRCGTVVHLTASRCHPEAARVMQLVDATEQWSVDFAKGTVCRTRYDQQQAQAAAAEPVQERMARREQLWESVQRRELLPVEPVNAIDEELREFLGAVRGEQRPQVDGYVAARALDVAERVLEDARRRSQQFLVNRPPNLLPTSSLFAADHTPSRQRRAG